MNIQHATLVLLQALAALIAAVIAIFVWRRRRETPGANYLSLLMIGVCVWAFCGAAEYISQQFSTMVLWSKISIPGINLIGVAWFLFAVHFRGHAEWVNPKRIIALFILPAIIVFLYWTNEFHKLAWPSITPIPHGDYMLLEYEHGSIYWISVAYNYALIFMGSILIIQQALRFPWLYRLQAGLLIFSAFIPWATSLIYALRLGPFPEADFTPMAFAITGLLITLNLFSFRLLDVTPIAHGMLFQELPDAVLVIDTQDRVVNLNAAAEKWFGITADSSIGYPIKEILSRFPAILRRFQEGADGVWKDPTSDPGESRWIDARIKPLTNRNQRSVGKILVLRDVTGQRRVEQALQEMERKLERSQRMESLGILAGGIAHDFNNLLMGTMGNIEITLIDASLPSMHRRTLEAALNASHRAAEICQQMLAYSGKGRFVLQPVNLNQAVQEVQRSLKGSAPKQAELRYHGYESLPLIKADSTQIHQAIMNLALNAIEAIGDQSGTVTLSTGYQHFRGDELASPWLYQNLPDGVYAFVAVSDTGCGIPPENMLRIFEPFFSTKFIGRGLGLPAVLGIAH